MFARRAGEDVSLPPVILGSHLDTQPTGGKFDGVLGVLGALEVVRSLNDLKIKTRHPIEVANWTNEEGSRYAPAMVSSGVFAGVFTKEFAYSRVDPEGKIARRRARAHRLQGRRAGRRPSGPRLFRAAHRAGPDPRGRRLRRWDRHAWARPALVRDSLDRIREPRGLHADAAPQGRAARRRPNRGARQQNRTVQGAPRRLDRRHAQSLSQFSQRDPRRNLHDRRFPPSCRRDAERDGRGAEERGRGDYEGDGPRLRLEAGLLLRARPLRSGLRRGGSARGRTVRLHATATSYRAPATTPATWRGSRRHR